MKRFHLTFSALFVMFGVLALSACGTTVTPQQIVTEANAVATGLQGAINQVAQSDPNLIPAATLVQINQDLANAQAAANQLSTSLPATTGAATAKVVEGDINAVLNVLANPPINGLIPAPANEAVAAAAIVVPVLEGFVNTYIPTASASPMVLAVRAKLRAGAPQITSIDDAVAVLQRYGKH